MQAWFTSKPSRGHRCLVQGLVLSLAMQPVLPAWAGLAQSPLYLTAAVESNVMFILDDSGSMHWEITPDDYVYSYFVYPRPAGAYGGGDYENYVVSFRDGGSGVPAAEQATAAALRSPHVNKTYYNPAVTYRPWSKPAGLTFPGSPLPIVASATQFPNAPPAAAPHHPIRNVGTRNLTTNNTQSAMWEYCDAFPPVSGGCSTTSSTSRTFYPAVYFHYKGGALFNRASYDRIEIRSTTPTYTGHGRENRTDCANAAAATCTYAEEIQNFANWYTYYRSRVLASQAGIGHAFVDMGTDFRVGFGAINKTASDVDGVSTGTIIRGVRRFAGADRADFYKRLYEHVIPTAGTPLRRALDDAGIYFSRTDNRGPWANTPGTDDGTPTSQHLECRQNHTILMTDGYWNGAQAGSLGARANNDGTAGPSHTGPGGASFSYVIRNPFSDDWSDTLADVAMYYWKRDLRTDLANKVPTSPLNPAFWQHMSTFGVGLGVTGSVDPAAAFGAIGSGTPTINWPNPVGGGAGFNAAKLDDLLHASVNGRGGFFSAADPVTFGSELARILQDISDRVSSSAAVASNSTRLTSDTHVYQALFRSGDWSGQLKAFPLKADGSIGPEVWEASSKLPSHGARNILTWNGSAGTPFAGAMGALTAAQVSYLRGDASQEKKNGGAFRNRTTLLGDIVNADPHYVHREDFGYHNLPGAAGTGYPAFVSGKSSRTAMVYAAANDGMVHGFRASDGVERLAYVPAAIRDDLAQLTNPAYLHRYFVDGSPSAWDAYLAGAWRTVLVGSLGAGGKAVYALDVSNPDAFGVSHVLWEYTGNSAAEKDRLGHILGTVTVARMADGHFWAVFGNGYYSTLGRAVLFMVRADNPSVVRMIEVGPTGGNGLSTPILVDTNGDRVIDLVYAGDLQGNVWKFDTTATLPTGWKAAYGTTTPLFQARDASGTPQPITAAPEVGLPPPGAAGLMVYFGTGKYHDTGDNSTLGVQTVYGVLDKDGAGGTSDHAFSGTNHRTQLTAQKIIYEGTVGGRPVRALSDDPVPYAPVSGTPSRGWLIDLVSPPTPPGTAKGERMISSPFLFGGKLVFQTITPSASPCDFGGSSFLMQVKPENGGNLAAAGFDVNNDKTINDGDKVDIGGGVTVHVSGLDVGVGISGGFGKPIKAGDKAYVPVGGTSGAVGAPSISAGVLKPRATWRQIQ